jgi:hypothetical protein
VVCDDAAETDAAIRTTRIRARKRMGPPWAEII